MKIGVLTKILMSAKITFRSHEFGHNFHDIIIVKFYDTYLNKREVGRT